MMNFFSYIFKIFLKMGYLSIPFFFRVAIFLILGLIFIDSVTIVYNTIGFMYLNETAPISELGIIKYKGEDTFALISNIVTISLLLGFYAVMKIKERNESSDLFLVDVYKKKPFFDLTFREALNFFKFTVLLEILSWSIIVVFFVSVLLDTGILNSEKALNIYLMPDVALFVSIVYSFISKVNEYKRLVKEQ